MKKAHSLIYKLTFTIIMISLAACLGTPSGTPSTKDARKAVEGKLDPSLVKLISLERVNGLESTHKGNKSYDIKLKVTVEFLEDVHYQGSFLDADKGHTSMPIMQKNYDKGETLNHDVTLLFLKSEKGWIFDGCIMR